MKERTCLLEVWGAGTHAEKLPKRESRKEWSRSRPSTYKLNSLAAGSSLMVDGASENGRHKC